MCGLRLLAWRFDNECVKCFSYRRIISNVLEIQFLVKCSTKGVVRLSAVYVSVYLGGLASLSGSFPCCRAVQSCYRIVLYANTNATGFRPRPYNEDSCQDSWTLATRAACVGTVKRSRLGTVTAFRYIGDRIKSLLLSFAWYFAAACCKRD